MREAEQGERLLVRATALFRDRDHRFGIVVRGLDIALCHPALGAEAEERDAKAGIIGGAQGVRRSVDRGCVLTGPRHLAYGAYILILKGGVGTYARCAHPFRRV